MWLDGPATVILLVMAFLLSERIEEMLEDLLPITTSMPALKLAGTTVTVFLTMIVLAGIWFPEVPFLW